MKKRYRVRITVRFERAQTSDEYQRHSARMMTSMFPHPAQLGYGRDHHLIDVEFETPETEDIERWCSLAASRTLEFLGEGATIPQKGIAYSIIRPVVKCPICDGTLKLDEAGNKSKVSCENCGQIAERVSSDAVFFSKEMCEFARKQGVSILQIREKYLKGLL